MPVPYRKLKFGKLFQHQKTYDLICNAVSQIRPEQNIQELETHAISSFSHSILHNPELRQEYSEIIEIIGPELDKLDSEMPFLRFGEEGQHYAYELFLNDPPHWGSRGAPLFWDYAARAFTYDKLPMDAVQLEQKYRSLLSEFGIPYEEDTYVYIPQFAAGGMSSGQVGGFFAKESLETLLNRLGSYK